MKLFAMGGSYGSSATSIASTISKADGSFVFGSFVCPSPTVGTFISGIGGNSGGGTNSAIGLMALLGKCGNLNPSTVIVVNELTTVAGEFALAQFADGPGQNIGAPATNALGLNNAMSLAISNLADATTGSPASFLPSAGQCDAVPPPLNCSGLTRMNTLANILAACVNSSGPSSAACSTLFSNTGTPASGTTLEAVHAIATSPGLNVSAIFGVQGPAATQSYQPTLGSAPTDWTISLNYTGGGLNSPLGIAVDASGNAWVANNGGSGSVTKMNSLGTALSPPSGFTGGGLSNPVGIAIDVLGNAWQANNGGIINGGPSNGISSVTELSPSGLPLSPSAGFAAGSLTSASGVTIDLNSLVWVVDNGGNSMLELCGAISKNCPTKSPAYNTGDVISGSPHTGGGLNNPAFAAIDASNLVWVANNGHGTGIGSSVSELCGSTTTNCPASAPATGDPISGPNGYGANGGGGLLAPLFISVDLVGNVWVANTANNNLSEFCGAITANCPPQVPPLKTGDPISPASGYTGGGLNTPVGIVVDASGNLWIANSGNNSVTETSSIGQALSPSTGFTGGGLNRPSGPAVDASGNLWLTNTGNNSLTELVGAARPVKVPLIGPPTLP
jgi:NHL repeat-containing protein